MKITDLSGCDVYLSGAISSDPDFVAKFAKYKALALESGAKRVLSPTIFPAGWSYAEYMDHCLLMIRHSNTILMLPGWELSPGAQAELAYAKCLGRKIVNAHETNH